MWIEEECKYDIAAMYGISHWWFQRQRFYIDRHTSEGDRRAVRTHMRILSVVRIEVFSLYGYDYMKKIVLRRADLQEYIIAERDFKYLYPSDFEDLYLLNLQGHLNHLPPTDKKILTTAVNLWTRNLVIRQRVEDFQLGIESYQSQLNLTKPRWDATGFEFNHDFTVIDSPRAITFRDKYGVQMIMHFNEIHKFSDGTLQQIDEALDYWVKEFTVNRMNLDKRNLSYLEKGFVGGRVQERETTILSAENQMKTSSLQLRSSSCGVTCEILLRIKLVTTGKKRWCDSLGITLVPGSELTNLTNRFTLIVLSALRRSDTENRQVGPHGSGGSSYGGSGDSSFQWSQFTAPCSHLRLSIKDTMTTKRLTTQLPLL
ncbi:hypothetical protein Tco_0348025 [Tanacetum coccineum]